MKHGKWLILLSVMMPVIFLSAAAYLLLFGLNQFSLELELLGQESVTLEYGEHYVEPGCRVRLRGTELWQSGLELEIPVQISGEVKESKLGKYALNYGASCFGMQAFSIMRRNPLCTVR